MLLSATLLCVSGSLWFDVSSLLDSKLLRPSGKTMLKKGLADFVVASEVEADETC